MFVAIIGVLVAFYTTRRKIALYVNFGLAALIILLEANGVVSEGARIFMILFMIGNVVGSGVFAAIFLSIEGVKENRRQKQAVRQARLDIQTFYTKTPSKTVECHSVNKKET